MSAAAHRQEAARERDEAQQALTAHEATGDRIERRVPGDPHAVMTSEELRPDRVPMVGSGRWHLWVAEARAEHAREHEAAAAELERFEQAECKDIPPSERASCPLLVGAAVVLDVKGGVEVRFESGAPVDEVVARMRCHQAYARTQGFENTADCPLYTRGLRIDRSHRRIVRLTGANPEEAAVIRARSRELTLKR